jgi:hypothetical protein
MATAQELASASAVEIIVSPPPDGDFKLIFDAIHAHEELGRPFHFEIEASSGKAQEKINKVVGASVTVWLWNRSEKRQEKFFNGIATRVTAHGMSNVAPDRYRIEVRSWNWLLTRQHDVQDLPEDEGVRHHHQGVPRRRIFRFPWRTGNPAPVIPSWNTAFSITKAPTTSPSA